MSDGSEHAQLERLRAVESFLPTRSPPPIPGCHTINAANEEAVAEFIAGRLSFGGIAALVATAMEAASARGIMREPATVEEAVSVDHSTRLLTLGLLPEIAAKAS